MRIINEEYAKTELQFEEVIPGDIFLFRGGTGHDAYLKLDEPVSCDGESYNAVLLSTGEVYHIDSNQVVYVQDATLKIRHRNPYGN